MPAPRALAACAVLGLGLVTTSCNRPTEEQRAKAALEGRSQSGTSRHSLDDRIPSITAAPVGAQPGYVAGSVIYASARADAIAALWDPLREQALGDAAITGLAALLDEGPRVREVLAAFGIASAARVSASLRRLGEGHGVHLRIHVPVGDRLAFEARAREVVLATFAGKSWASACEALGPSLTCAGDGTSLVLVRPVADGYVADLFWMDEGEPDRARHARIEASVKLPGGESRPEVEALGGDAVALVDGPGVVELLRGRSPRAAELLARLRATERLFEGATIEVEVERDRVIARGRWLVREASRARLKSVFELDPVDADVPTIAALCDGSLLCARSRGLPARRRLVGLATGLYADFDTLRQLADRPETQLVLALETWPNAIASAVERVLGSPESMLLRNAAEIADRVLGFGFSLRSLESGEHGRVAYARMNAADLDTLRTFVQLGGSAFSTVGIPGVDGRVESTRTPIPELPDRTYAVYDPGAWGWTVAADADEQIAWLARLAHDDGAVPMIYVETPDLGRLLGGSKHLAKRGLRAQMTLTSDWAPELRVAFGELE